MKIEPAHTARHNCNSHKPTHRPKIAIEPVCFPSLFADPKNKIRLVINWK